MTQIDLSTPLGITIALLPEIILSIAALFVLLVVSWRHRTAADSRLAGWLSLLGVVASACGLAALWIYRVEPDGLAQMVALDPLPLRRRRTGAHGRRWHDCDLAGYMERESLIEPEYYPLILLATAGMMFMSGAEDLIVLFLGLEVMSVAVYVLAGYNRSNPFSAEAALKYFLIGAFASGFLLYGIALVYGATGTTNLSLIGAQLAGGRSVDGGTRARPAAHRLRVQGRGRAVSHVGSRRVRRIADPGDGLHGHRRQGGGLRGPGARPVRGLSLRTEVWQPVIFWMALASMVVGNLVALSHRSLKRMLAYSSIGHAGYLLVAVWSGSQVGRGGASYLFAYVLTTLASFGFLAALGRGGERDLTNDDLAGLATSRPRIALGLSICMLSLLGFPGTFGFIGKWYILFAVIAEGQLALAVVLVLTSVISAGYYLPVIMAMYMKPAPGVESHN